MAEDGDFVTGTASRRNERQHGQQVSKGGRGGEQDAHGTPQRDVAAMSSAARRRARNVGWWRAGSYRSARTGRTARPPSPLPPAQPYWRGSRFRRDGTRDVLGGTEWFCPQCLA